MYWALIAKLMQTDFNGQRWGKKAWHAMFKDLFLPSEVVKLPSGKSVVYDPSSSDLDPAEFSDYIEKVFAWSAEHGITLDEEIA